MLRQRKNELIGKLISFLLESNSDNGVVFEILHNRIGLSQAELHEVNINCLDKYFEPQTNIELFKNRIESNLAEYRNQWLSMSSEKLIEKCF